MRVVTLVLLAACGDNAAPCDYSEADDGGNAATSEMTNLAIGGVAKNVCGAVDNGHFNRAFATVDEDTYHVTLDRDADLMVRVSGEPALAVLDDVSVRLFDANQALLAAGRYVPALADHGVFRAQL